MGEIAFLADYVELDQADAKYSKELRFSEACEKLIAKWNQDWSRVWNDETRHIAITPWSDLDAAGEILKRNFTGADVLPNYIDSLMGIRDAQQSVKATKLTVDLYPQHSLANGVWGIMLTLAETTAEGREMVKKASGDPGHAM